MRRSCRGHVEVILPQVARHRVAEEADVEVPPDLADRLRDPHVVVHAAGQLGPVRVQTTLPARAVPETVSSIIIISFLKSYLENNQLLSFVPGRKQSQ